MISLKLLIQETNNIIYASKVNKTGQVFILRGGGTREQEVKKIIKDPIYSFKYRPRAHGYFSNISQLAFVELLQTLKAMGYNVVPKNKLPKKFQLNI